MLRKTPCFEDGTVGPEFSLLYLTDILCSADAKLRDKNNDGYLNGMELGATVHSFEKINAIADRHSKPLPGEGYTLMRETRGYVVTAMQCTDRLNRFHKLAFRGEDKDAFALSEEEARKQFPTVGAVESKIRFIRMESLGQKIRIQFPDRTRDVTDQIRFGDPFPNAFKIGANMEQLETLKDCTPIIEPGALLEIKYQSKPRWQVQGGGAQPQYLLILSCLFRSGKNDRQIIFI